MNKITSQVIKQKTLKHQNTGFNTIKLGQSMKCNILKGYFQAQRLFKERNLQGIITDANF